MFNFSNSLLIASLFDILMKSVGRIERSPAVAGCKRVEHTHIKESVDMPVSPKSLCRDIQTGSILIVGGSV